MILATTSGGEQKNLLAVTEILAGLRFDEKLLEGMFRGAKTMIESPILQKWLREGEVKTLQELILEKIEHRFTSVPPDVSAEIRLVVDQTNLKSLLDSAYSSPSLDAFRQALTLLQQPTAN